MRTDRTGSEVILPEKFPESSDPCPTSVRNRLVLLFSTRPFSKR